MKERRSAKQTIHQKAAGGRFRLKQVIVNLLDNAIKQSPVDGEITPSTRSADGQAILGVAARGPGIPAEALPQNFDRSFRADSVRTQADGGAGLGLSIVRSICLAHGGTVEAANREEGGCRITVRLPLSKVGSPLRDDPDVSGKLDQAHDASRELRIASERRPYLGTMRLEDIATR